MKIIIKLSFLITIVVSFVFSQPQFNAGFIYKLRPKGVESSLCKINISCSDNEKNTVDKPAQIVIMLDISESMAGNPLAHVISAIKNLLSSLNPETNLSVITVGDNATEVSQMSAVSTYSQKAFDISLSSVRSGGECNVKAGLKLASDEFSKVLHLPTFKKALFFVSNSSFKNPDNILSEIKVFSENDGFSFYSLGYDQYFNEDLLINASLKTGGKCFFVEEDSMSNIEPLLLKEVSDISDIHYVNNTFELSLPDKMTISDCYGGKISKNGMISIDNVTTGNSSIIFSLNYSSDTRRDITLVMNYMNAYDLSDDYEEVYLTIPKESEKPQLDKTFAPEIFDFLVRKELYGKCVGLKKDSRRVRKDMSDLVDFRIKEFEEDNEFLSSDSMKRLIQRLYRLKNDIDNYAIDDDLLAKKLKYSFVNFLY